MGAVPAVPNGDDPIDHLWQQLGKNTEKYGLYMKDAAIGMPQNPDDPDITMENMNKESIVAAIKDGKDLVVMVSFIVGDLAWDDRVQHPEKFEMDQEFRTIVPDAFGDIKAQMEERLKNDEDPLA